MEMHINFNNPLQQHSRGAKKEKEKKKKSNTSTTRSNDD